MALQLHPDKGGDPENFKLMPLSCRQGPRAGQIGHHCHSFMTGDDMSLDHI